MASYAIGDKVRMIRVTPSLYRDDTIDREVAAFLELCVGKVFRVEGFDEYGQLTPEDVRQAARKYLVEKSRTIVTLTGAISTGAGK